MNEISLNYKKVKNQVSVEREEFILEQATEEGGEAYVYNQSKDLTRVDKRIKQFFRDRLVTIIAFYLLGIAFIYFAIRMLLI